MTNWSKLYSQGRCREIGVPWNDEELNARYTLGIPAEYVRRGCLTMEDYKETSAEDVVAKDAGQPILESMTRVELMVICEAEGVSGYDPATVSQESLIKLLVAHRSRKVETPVVEDEKPEQLDKLSKPNLIAIATELGLQFDQENCTKKSLIELIESNK